MLVTEETARRIADKLDQLVDLIDRLAAGAQVERIVGGVRMDPIICSDCGGGGGCHSLTCRLGNRPGF